jgi:hypothetical protein
MMASARDSYGGRRWMAMSSGNSGGQVRSEIETPALVVNRRRRQAAFDQLDPPAIRDLVVS